MKNILKPFTILPSPPNRFQANKTTTPPKTNMNNEKRIHLKMYLLQKNNTNSSRSFLFPLPKGSSQGTGDPKQVMLFLKILVEGMGTVPSEHDLCLSCVGAGICFFAWQKPCLPMMENQLTRWTPRKIVFYMGL